jgi:hypothetical protein
VRPGAAHRSSRGITRADNDEGRLRQGALRVRLCWMYHLRAYTTGGTSPGARGRGVSVWTPPARSSFRSLSGRTPPGSRKNCHSEYGPPPFSGFARVAAREADRD